MAEDDRQWFSWKDIPIDVSINTSGYIKPRVRDDIGSSFSSEWPFHITLTDRKSEYRVLIGDGWLRREAVMYKPEDWVNG